MKNYNESKPLDCFQVTHLSRCCLYSVPALIRRGVKNALVVGALCR